jgi:hypothetical protein
VLQELLEVRVVRLVQLGRKEFLERLLLED